MEEINMKKEGMAKVKVETKPSVTPSKKRFTPFKFLVILLVVLLVGTLGYFGFSHYQEDLSKGSELSKLNAEKDALSLDVKSLTDQLKTTKTDLEGKSKIVDVSTVVPSGARSLTYLSACGVGLAMPDTSKVYETNKTWRLLYSKITDSGFSTNPFIGGSVYVVFLKNDEDASGYNPGLVSISCAKNTSFTLETLASTYIANIKKWSTDTAKDFGETFSTSGIKDLGAQNIWGVDTKKVTISAFSAGDAQVENGNLFISGENIYYVYYASNSSNSKSITSMKDIFNSLVVFKK